MHGANTPSTSLVLHRPSSDRTAAQAPPSPHQAGPRPGKGRAPRERTGREEAQPPRQAYEFRSGRETGLRWEDVDTVRSRGRRAGPGSSLRSDNKGGVQAPLCLARVRMRAASAPLPQPIHRVQAKPGSL